MTLPSGLLVTALIRHANVDGGTATVIHRGDPDRGTVLILCRERGVAGALLERVCTPDGRYRTTPLNTTYGGNEAEIDQYIERRRRSDPDLWLVELDIAQAEQFAAHVLDAG